MLKRALIIWGPSILLPRKGRFISGDPLLTSGRPHVPQKLEPILLCAQQSNETRRSNWSGGRASCSTSSNATLISADGKTMATGVYGYMQTIAMVVLDQGGNIMKEPNDMFVVENAQPDNEAAKEIVNKCNQITTNGVEKGQASNGAFYDAQVRGTAKTPLDITTKQDVTVRRYFGPNQTDFKEIFKVTGNKIRFNDNSRKVTFTPGQVKKL